MRGHLVALALVALATGAACGKKAEPSGTGGGGGGGDKAAAPALPPGVKLIELSLAAAGPLYANLRIDAPQGADARGVQQDAIVGWPGLQLQITPEVRPIAKLKHEYESIAAQIQATILITKETDTELEYTIERGPQREHGLEMHVAVGGTTLRCFMPQSSQDPAQRDIARAVCASLRGKPGTVPVDPAKTPAAPAPGAETPAAGAPAVPAPAKPAP